MKKILSVSFGILAVLAIAVSCNKVITDVPGDTPTDNPETPAAKQITISATLSDALTKVTFTPGTNGSGKPMMALAWESGDKLRVANHDAPTSYSDFELNPDCVGKQAGQFFGTPVDATSYDVWVINSDDPTNMQVQASDGDASHIEYVAQATGVSAADLTNITFTEISSVLGLQAKLPAGAAAKITSVVLTASENIFFEGKTLTIGITTSGDADNDDILNLYATLPSGSQAIPTGTTLFVKFNSSDTAHKVYTAYRELGSGLTFASGALNNLKMNCVNTDKYAGKDDDGTSAHPYLIADKYQLNSVNSLATGGQTTYFKMIDNVDMTGVTSFNKINTNSGYTQIVNFDGNGKTISHLNSTVLFYVFKGSIQNLTLDQCTRTTDRAIFADYVQGTGHSITNVDITNSSYKRSSEKVAALLGIINKGSSGTTSVTITDCDIVNTSVSSGGSYGNVGGMIGYVEGKVVVENCIVSKTGESIFTITGKNSNTGGLIGNITGEDSNESEINNCSVSDVNVTGIGVIGGLIGFADAKVTVSGCSYRNGTVKLASDGRYIGGLIGSTGNYESEISNCQVENATVDASARDDGDVRAGGFIGEVKANVQVKGCTVGTSTTKVLVKTGKANLGADNAVGGTGDNADTPINAGGFVGVNYGTITKNGEVRSKAYAKLTSTNEEGTPIDLGGFAGFHTGTIEYSDAEVDMSNLQGQYIGGFSGLMTTNDAKADNCTVKGNIKGNNFTGGFVGCVNNFSVTITNNRVLEGTTINGQSSVGGFAGIINNGTVRNNTANATITCRNANGGGFVGAIQGGSFNNCSASGSIERSSDNTSGNTFGGFAAYASDANFTKCSSTMTLNLGSAQYVGGLIGDFKTANTVSKCYYSGEIKGASNYGRGGLIGVLEAVAASIEDCYTSGSCQGSSATQVYGGIVGEMKANGTVTRCYSTMSFQNCGRVTGGIVGRACSGGWPVNNASSNTISNCIAWNPYITYAGTAGTSASCGAIIGYTSFKNTLSNCYRRSDMNYKNSNTAVGTTCQTSMVDQIDCDGTNWAINGNRPAGGTPAGTSADAQYQAPYYGIAAASTTTVSSIAQSLGWSTEIWDFTGDLPTLK